LYLKNRLQAAQRSEDLQVLLLAPCANGDTLNPWRAAARWNCVATECRSGAVTFLWALAKKSDPAAQQSEALQLFFAPTLWQAPLF
jgi:hypothetical protein